MQPNDWYRLVNGKVFLWARRDRLDEFWPAYFDRPTLVLVVSTASLVADPTLTVWFSPDFNSGSATRKPKRRGRSSFK